MLACLWPLPPGSWAGWKRTVISQPWEGVCVHVCVHASLHVCVRVCQRQGKDHG